MERCFTARELVITSSRLHWNAAKVYQGDRVQKLCHTAWLRCMVDSR